VLEELDPKHLRRVQCERQVSRRCDYKDSASACHGAASEISTTGTVTTYHEEEEMEDALTVYRLMKWRDWLLETEPFTVEVTAKK